MNKWESSIFPSLHHRKEGRAASSRKCCEATDADAAGVVFLLDSIGKPPRPRYQWRLRDILLMARPPLLAVMQGDGMNESRGGGKLQLLSGDWSRQV